MENCPQLVGSTNRRWATLGHGLLASVLKARCVHVPPALCQSSHRPRKRSSPQAGLPSFSLKPLLCLRPTQTSLRQQCLNHNLGPTHHPLLCALPPSPALITPEPGPRQLGTVPVPQSLLKLFKFANPYSSLLICLTRSFPWKPQ